jgi:hypothetical protein
VLVLTTGTGPVELQVYSTPGGRLLRNLEVTGIPPTLAPSAGSSLHVSGGKEVFWSTSTGPGPAGTGKIVETPLAGGPSRVVATGVAAIPSPDGSQLFVERSSAAGGREVSGLEVVDLPAGKAVRLPPIEPVRADETFSWLPDGHTVVALYPGYSGCDGATSCPVLPVAPDPAAWTIDTADPSAGWRTVSGVGRQLSHVTLLGPGRDPGTVAAETPVGVPQLLTLEVAGGMQTVDRVDVPGSCFSVDHSGTAFLCSTDRGQIASVTLTHPAPQVLTPGSVYFDEMAWW